jgi:hypothetical protein
MCGIFDRFLSTEASSMHGDPIPFDPHIEMVRIGEDFTELLAVIGGDGITIGLKLDETGFTDCGRDNSIRAIGNGRKGSELFFFQGLQRGLLGGAVDALISFDPPEADLPV